MKSTAARSTAITSTTQERGERFVIHPGGQTGHETGVPTDKKKKVDRRMDR